MMNQKKLKGWGILVILMILVVGIIFIIGHVKGNGDIPPNNSNNNNLNEETIKCIGGNSKMVISKTCSACAYQKQILKDYLENYQDYIEIIDISKNPGIFEAYDIEGVPTWIINEKTYVGAQSINKLKQLTEC